MRIQTLSFATNAPGAGFERATCGLEDGSLEAFPEIAPPGVVDEGDCPPAIRRTSDSVRVARHLDPHALHCVEVARTLHHRRRVARVRSREAGQYLGRPIIRLRLPADLLVRLLPGEVREG